MRIHYLQHEPFEGLGSMEHWFRERGVELRATHLYRGERLPAVGEVERLVVMGGGMSVNDEAELPWLREEKAFVRACVAAGKPVLGVCLGAQLIASTFGAAVYRNGEKEIGWWPLQKVDGANRHPLGGALPEGAEVFHWHGETFDLPDGAVWLASSGACRHQAFALGRNVLGLQFHLETTEQSARELIEGAAGDLVAGRFVQTAVEMLARPERFAAVNAQMGRVLEVWMKA